MAVNEQIQLFSQRLQFKMTMEVLALALGKHVGAPIPPPGHPSAQTFPKQEIPPNV